MTSRTIKLSPEEKKREMQWKVESALRTINEYNNVIKDKNLMGMVKQAAMDQVKLVTGAAPKPPMRKLKK